MNVQQTWKGVVMIIRADPSKMASLVMPMAHVMSAVRLEYGGRRAIATRVPYDMVKQYFNAEDGDSVEVYAELTGEHLEFYERASKSEFFLTREVGALVNPQPLPLVH